MAISKCTVSASLRNLSDAVPSDLTAEFVIRNPKSFFHGDDLIGPFELRDTFDVNGEASIEVIETETPAQKLEFSFVLTEGTTKRIIRFTPAIVPDDASADLGDITQVDPFNAF